MAFCALPETKAKTFALGTGNPAKTGTKGEAFAWMHARRIKIDGYL